ncbi:MAG: hypothetical protein ACREH3_12525 [Geminicoccales bacterium]
MHRSSDFDRYGDRTYRDRDDRRDGFERVGARVLDFLRSRTADQWLMFLAGVVVGMIVG